MKVRPMRAGDFPGIKAVYNVRAEVTVGLVRRTPDRWKFWRRMRHPATLWLVAEDRGRIIGYAIGLRDEGHKDIGEVMWLPEFDGTQAGARLLGAMLSLLERTKTDTLTIWGMEDSPTFKLPIPLDFERTESAGVFMAGVADVSLLLRDAKRILRKRVKGRLRLNVGERSVVIGSGVPEVKVAMEENVLLGLLLGIRNLDKELKRGNVEYQPKAPRALDELRLAFPAKKFLIEDVW